MRYSLRTLLIAMAQGAFLVAMWFATGSVVEAAGWAGFIVFFAYCYWMVTRRQAATNGSYRYAQGDSSVGGEGGI